MKHNEHNEHYKKLDMQPWDIMKADFTRDEYRGYLKGNILKYVLRNKEGIKDYEKALVYAEELVLFETSRENKESNK